MHALVECENCKHGAPLHGAGGCDVFRCACAWSRTAILDAAITQIRREIHESWLPDRLETS